MAARKAVWVCAPNWVTSVKTSNNHILNHDFIIEENIVSCLPKLRKLKTCLLSLKHIPLIPVVNVHNTVLIDISRNRARSTHDME